jgi:hypothetical protein
MSDSAGLPTAGDELAALRAHADGLERQLAEVQAKSSAKLVQLALQTEALRAGMVDLDGLKLIDPAVLSPGENGEFHGAADVIAKLRRDKPWLFGAASSSSAAVAPTAAVTRRKLATEMSLDEWRSARAELLRRR